MNTSASPPIGGHGDARPTRRIGRRLRGGVIIAALVLVGSTAVAAGTGAQAAEPSVTPAAPQPFSFTMGGSISVSGSFIDAPDEGYYSLSDIPVGGVEISGFWDPLALRILSAELTFDNFSIDVSRGESGSLPTLVTEVEVTGGTASLSATDPWVPDDESGFVTGGDGSADLRILAQPVLGPSPTTCTLTFDSLGLYAYSFSALETGTLDDLWVQLFSTELWGGPGEPLAPRFEPASNPDCASLNDAFALMDSTANFSISMSSDGSGGEVGAPWSPYMWSVTPEVGAVTVTVVPNLSGPLPESMLVTAERVRDGSPAGTCVPQPLVPDGWEPVAVDPQNLFVPVDPIDDPYVPVFYEYSCRIGELSETETYTFTATATNEFGTSFPSFPSSKVTPGLGSSTPQFTDVPVGLWYVEATSMLKLRGITTGTSPTTFSPGPPVTREQMAAFMWRLLDKPSTTLTAPCGFSDYNAIDDFAREAACWLKESGVTRVDTYRPKDVVTRAEMAAFLHRLVGEPEYFPSSCALLELLSQRLADLGSIPDWAQEAACWLKLQGITDNNPYRPAGLVDRAQMATFLYRLGGYLGLWVSPLSSGPSPFPPPGPPEFSW